MVPPTSINTGFGFGDVLKKQVMGGATTLLPIVSKTFCSNSQTVLMIRKRPRNINGGGFVVMNINQHIVFAVDGCGVLGVSGECVIRDGDGNSLLVIRRKVISFPLHPRAMIPNVLSQLFLPS